MAAVLQCQWDHGINFGDQSLHAQFPGPQGDGSNRGEGCRDIEWHAMAGESMMKPSPRHATTPRLSKAGEAQRDFARFAGRGGVVVRWHCRMGELVAVLFGLAGCPPTLEF